MTARPRLPALLALLMALGGCGREVVGGGQKEVETVAVGDATPDASAFRALFAPAAPPEAARPSAALPLGTLSFTAAVSLVAEDGSVVPLTVEPHTVLVQLYGGERVPVTRRYVPDAAYVRARVAFTRVAADVTGGVPGIVGAVKVGIPAGDSVVVERTVAIPPGPGRTTLVVDLNSSAWVAASVGGLVSSSTFAGAVRVRAE